MVFSGYIKIRKGLMLISYFQESCQKWIQGNSISRLQWNQTGETVRMRASHPSRPVRELTLLDNSLYQVQI